VRRLAGVRGALLDVDGTLLQGDAAIPGAAEALARLRAAGIAVRFVTNTTRRSRAEVAAALTAAGIPAVVDEVLAPALLARRLIGESGRRNALLLIPESTRRELDGVVQSGEPADWVVVGDLGRGFDWEVLQRAFLALRGGARLLALHKNPFWSAGDAGFLIDAGAFVVALEYAAGVEALVVGKPSRDFFELCLADIGLPSGEVIVIGDDPVSDSVGGAAAGSRTVLVQTGKWSEEGMRRSGAQPDLLIPSIAELT
jgi:HAD superfamily hydrolase (TIGR01458 family)